MRASENKDRLVQVLEEKEENYLYPFFWQHGSSKETLEMYVEKIYQSGCRAFCVESRPHPDFLGEKWWEDLDTILRKAEELDMKIWLLDDAHFPTGYANGKVKEAAVSLKRSYLVHREVDFTGPVENGKISIYAKNGRGGLVQDGEELVATILAERESLFDFSSKETGVDLTDCIKNGSLTLQLPKGMYRLYVIVQCPETVEPFSEYIDMTNPDSVQILLNEIYEKHYQHYSEKFGNVITGFFSDEPGFYNTVDERMYSFNSQIGSDMRIPWNPYIASEFVKNLLKRKLINEGQEKEIRSLLPALWFPHGEKANEIRAIYMDSLTYLYSQNFTKKVAEWCHEHGVSYVGHVIEDNNSHARLGPGTGHYFRAMKGQDMSGIDTVIMQIMPGADYLQYGVAAGQIPSDGEFYFYGLAKLGASMAHIDLSTNGRAMCEIFGAYGWGEGIELMKWLADHMMVRGINTFVPHAFSEKSFPDPDGPPHFYAQGYNPQYRYMRCLFTYMNRICHLLNGGKSMAQVGVLYHAEAEWLGNTMYFQTIGKQLLKNQIDYEVMPLDYLEYAVIENKHIIVGNVTLSVLLIPMAEKYPEKLQICIQRCKTAGVKVYQVMGNLPENSRTGTLWKTSEKIEHQILADCEQYSLEEIVPVIKTAFDEAVFYDEMKVGSNEWLRYYHYQMEDGRQAYVFFNESLTEQIRGKIALPYFQRFYYYDAFENQLFDLFHESVNEIPLLLERGEMKIYVTGKTQEDILDAEEQKYKTVSTPEKDILWSIYEGEVKISIAEYTDMESFREIKIVDAKETGGKLPLLEEIENNFSGVIRYEFALEKNRKDGIFIDLGEVREAVQIWINGRKVGTKIGAPFKFELTRWMKDGENKIKVEVATKLAPVIKDSTSRYMVLYPEYIKGPIKIGNDV